ncbi:Helix-turn-helix domain protein [compost metagenome]
MDRRTVHRRLARSGLSFAVIVNEVRRELAQRQVGDARVALSEVADMLGFTHASAFTRWFTAEFGDSPTRWRQAHR